MVARAKIDILKTNRLPSAAAFEDAASSADPICLLPTEGRVFAALLRMPAYDDAVLMVQREVSQLAIDFPGVSRAAAAEYLTYDSLRRSIQITFASVFLLIALIALLSAVWFGMNFANRFVAPIRRLINAADQVASGNFYAQVPTKKTSGDLTHLGESFNKMTQELRRQHAGLIAASDLIDTRRRFTEAVLSGVSPGVIGLDAAGFVTIANPAAERMLDLASDALVGQSLAHAVPELAPVLAESESRPRSLQQQQIQLTRSRGERTVTVRVTSEQAQGASRGSVVTLDDITDLVQAQRSSAWGDVARRIAHEIKNPLTPIQLSAERIRRKYGKVITTDKEVFDQCTATIVRQVDEIKRMVDEFSAFARMPKPAIAPNDLTEIAKQNLFMMRVAHPDIDFAFSAQGRRGQRGEDRGGLRHQAAQPSDHQHPQERRRGRGRGAGGRTRQGQDRVEPRRRGRVRGDRRDRQRQGFSRRRPAAAARALHDHPRGWHRVWGLLSSARCLRSTAAGSN